MTLSAFDFASLNLPISQVIEPLRKQLRDNNEAILEAEPGAGKTTCVPLALLDQPWLKQQKILMLEPRRLAAKHAASRMASLLGETLGQTVGYRIRHENRVSSQTRIEVITEGILVRMLQDDPSLEGIGLVIFDEFHERNLDSDLALALCLESREYLRDELPLKLLIMSATLEQAPLEKLLDCASLFCPGRTYPVDIRYQNLNLKQEDILPQLAQTLSQVVKTDEGNILVFLPGQQEIRRLEERLEKLIPSDVKILPLYGKLDFKAQEAVLSDQAHSGRKIILATAIAQTSLTITGIQVVIDSGLSREARFDANTGLTRLHTRKVSQAESIQRSGRAGRTSHGICYRWWSEDAQSRLLAQAQAQIQNADLTSLALELAKWGINQPDELTWLTPVPSGHWLQAVNLLQRLGALENTEGLKLSPLGQAMSTLSAPARIARLICAGLAFGAEEISSELAALIMEGPIKHSSQVDLLEQVELFRLSPKNFKKILKSQSQIKQQIKSLPASLTKQISTTRQQDSLSESQMVATLLACAYPDRIAKQQSQNNAAQWQDYKLSNGRLAQLNKAQYLAQEPLIIALETGGNAKFNKDQIFQAVRLDPTLFEHVLKPLTQVKQDASWPKNSERLLSSQDTMVDKLCLDSKLLHKVSSEAEIRACCQHIRSLGLHLLNWDKSATRIRERLTFIANLAQSDEHKNQPELDQFKWPLLDDSSLLEHLEIWLAPYLSGINSHTKLKQLKLADILLNQLDWSQQQSLSKLAPETISAASGNQIRLDYQAFPPSLKVKLQEMFGTVHTPEIAGIKLKIELLSPAQKPLAITQDLNNFWKNAYHEVKKEMRGRYPKHNWPDNPLEAIASAKTKKALKREQI
ncbi:ATP-dependent helicase HrpB [Marinomonas sp. 42_23_T18]|nr:ATP-dependent helicase HrpB [Marinomonas sp. 42_23_T18]